VKYISADELKKHWEILEFELLKYIRDGLPAYDRIGLCTITDSQVVYEKEESIDDFRKRLFLRESKHETERIEKNNSAEYAINAHRLVKAGQLDSELPPPQMYDVEKVRKRVETRIAEEYDLLPTSPLVPPGRRLIPAELNDSDLHALLNEIKTFQFIIQDINIFAQLHELKLINEAEVPQVDATPTQTPVSVESCVHKTKCWIPGWELRERWVQWDINYYDIVDIIVNGDLTAYNLLDHTPVDIDIEKQCKDQIGAFAEEHGKIALIGISLNSVMENQKKDLIRFVTGSLDEFLFKMAEVEEYERTHGLIPQRPQTEPVDPSAPSKVNRLNMTEEPEQMQQVPVDQSAIPNSSTPDRATSAEHADPEAFIRSLQVFHVDNTTIKIQYKRKSTDYTCKSIGFRDSKAKAWVTFLEILQSKDHFYKLGPANYYDEGLRKKVPVKEYSRRKALLKEIKKKLLYFLSKQYGVVFPPRVKLYELQPTQGDGVYLFLFQIPLDKPSYKTKDQALRLLETLIQEEASIEKIQQASETAMDAGATQDEVFEIVKDRLTSPQKYSETADEQEDGDEDKEE
jgi:hypothetical protein